MNTYKILKDKQEKEINAFPLGAAFNNRQFAEMMGKWGLTENDTDKIISIGAGCYIRKCDRDAFFSMLERFKHEKETAIAADNTGYGFIRDMFYYELANHEYCVTGELDETLDALGLTYEQLNADKRLQRGLKRACTQYLKDYQ